MVIDSSLEKVGELLWYEWDKYGARHHLSSRRSWEARDETCSNNGAHHFEDFIPEITLLARAGDPEARLWRNILLLQNLKILDENFETFHLW